MAKRARSSTTLGGWGWQHQTLRKRLAPIVATGTVPCAYCGELIKPGEPWHLGHDDYDRNLYGGPEHASCNCKTAIRGGRGRFSRVW